MSNPGKCYDKRWRLNHHVFLYGYAQMTMPGWWPVNWWPFCVHDFALYRELHGDERNYGARWDKCVKCGLLKLIPWK